MCPSKLEVLIYPTVWQISLQFQRQIYGVFNTPNAKLTLGDCDNDQQTEIAMWTFCSPISQFLAVARSRNHLANPLSSSTSSKIPNLAWEFRRYLSQFQRCTVIISGFGGHIDIYGWRSLLYLPTLFYTCTWSYTATAVGILTVPFVS